MKAKENTYYIFHNNKDVFHHGFVEKGVNIETGQLHKEFFSEELEYLDRLSQLGVEISEQNTDI